MIMETPVMRNYKSRQKQTVFSHWKYHILYIGVMQINTLEKAIRALEFHKALFSEWKSKYPDSESDFALAE